MDIDEIKSVPNVPVSHPFVERLIGTIRREYLNQMIFWNERDLQNKLDEFKQYYNASRTHYSLNGQTPEEKSGVPSAEVIPLNQYQWIDHCRGLFKHLLWPEIRIRQPQVQTMSGFLPLFPCQQV